MDAFDVSVSAVPAAIATEANAKTMITVNIVVKTIFLLCFILSFPFVADRLQPNPFPVFQEAYRLTA